MNIHSIRIHDRGEHGGVLEREDFVRAPLNIDVTRAVMLEPRELAGLLELSRVSVDCPRAVARVTCDTSSSTKGVPPGTTFDTVCSVEQALVSISLCGSVSTVLKTIGSVTASLSTSGLSDLGR